VRVLPRRPDGEAGLRAEQEQPQGEGGGEGKIDEKILTEHGFPDHRKFAQQRHGGFGEPAGKGLPDQASADQAAETETQRREGEAGHHLVGA